MAQDLGKIIFKTVEKELFSTSDATTQTVGSTISLNDRIDNYDYIFIQYESGAGGNMPTQIIKPSRMITPRITMTSVNLPDSNPTGAYLYEWTMKVRDDKRTIEIEKSNGVRLFDKNENITVKDFGVRYIFGLKLNS